MGFDLATAKPVPAGAPPAARGGFDLATARPIDAPNPQRAGVPGYDAQGRPQQPQQPVSFRDERPVNGVDVTLGRKSLAGDVFDRVLGVVETPVTAVTGTVGGIVGSLAGVGKTLTGGKYGTQQGVREGEELAGRVAQAMTYLPRTQTARNILETAAPAAEALGALPSAEIVNLGRAASSTNTAIRGLAYPSALAQDAADAAAIANGQKGSLRDLVRKPQPDLSGVGAAATTDATLRQQRAADLGLSPLTKGQATREPGQVRFERETAKQPEGKPLANRFVEQNQQLLSKFDDYFDQTGAQAPTLRAAGKVVDQALVEKYNKARAEVSAAYDAARAAGELAEPVPYKGLADYLEQHSAEIGTNNVPMLAAVKAKLAKLDPNGTGLISINDAEELRKMAGRLTQDGTPNAAYIGDVKKLIDSATEGAGGDLYRQARRLNENMARQFENAGVIDKMMRTKPGTTDRAVALEDVADHAILNGSLDDVRQVRRVLQAGGGEQGAQAWRELQGAAINKLRDTLFPPQGGQDAAGNIMARPSAFKKAVANLDADGKLEYVFGKQGAQQMRDLADAAVDVSYQTGANTSNTSAALQDVVAKLTGMARAIPGLSSAAKYVEQKAQSRALSNKVKDSLKGND